MKSKIDGFSILEYKATENEQRVTVQLKIGNDPVDTISIEISRWAPKQREVVWQAAEDAVKKALFDSAVVVTEDNETPLLF